jgi:hypothetical protein
VTLTDIPCSANSPQKFARKVMSQVFSKREMASGLFKKVGQSAKQELSPNRCSLIMSKLCVLFVENKPIARTFGGVNMQIEAEFI